MTSRPLRVFLCHSSNDKPAVRELYQKLRAEAENWIDPWLDKMKILPGQNWRIVIEEAVEASDIVIICLSNHSINKEGFVQREIRYAYDLALEKPDGVIFLIPLRLEECEVPRGMRSFQWVDYFGAEKEEQYSNLLEAMKLRHKQKLSLEKPPDQPVGRVSNPTKTSAPKQSQAASLTYDSLPNKLTLSNGMEFMRVPAGKFLMGSNNDNKLAYRDEKPQHTVDIPYDYWMARYPVTNAQYSQFKKKNFDKGKEKHPVVEVSWNDSMTYCQWLNSLLKAELPPGLVLRLPTEAEWEKAARGADGREYPWGNQFDKNKCNTYEGGKDDTTPVGLYSPQGDSPYGCADMSGNVWEWTHSLMKPYPYNVKDGREDENASGARVLRGGSFRGNERFARCAFRDDYDLGSFSYNVGFRVVVASPIPK